LVRPSVLLVCSQAHIRQAQPRLSTLSRQHSSSIDQRTPRTMGKDKGSDNGKDRERDKGILSKNFVRKHRDIPSNPSESERRASGDATPPKPQVHGGKERLGTSSGSSPSGPDGVKMSHDRPDAEQHHSSQPCQVPPADPKTNSTSEACKEQHSQPLREQDKQAPPQSVRGTLWEEAALGLDPRARKKLDDIIRSKREGQGADPSAKGQEGSSPANVVDLIVSTAEGLKEKDMEDTWRPVSPIRLKITVKRMLNTGSRSLIRSSREPWYSNPSATLRCSLISRATQP
jgi:hypothetical protein